MEDDITRMEGDYGEHTMDLLGILAASHASCDNDAPRRRYLADRLMALADKGVAREIFLGLREHVEGIAATDPVLAATLSCRPMARIVLGGGRGVEASLPLFMECVSAALRGCAIQDGSAYVQVSQEPMADDVSTSHTDALRSAGARCEASARCVELLLDVARALAAVPGIDRATAPTSKLAQLFGAVAFLGLRASAEGSQFVQPVMDLRNKVKTPLVYPGGVMEGAVVRLGELRASLAVIVTSVFTAQYVLMYHRRYKRYRIAMGLEKRDRLGIAPDADLSSEDEDFIHSDNEDVDEFMRSFFVEWDLGGVGVFVATAAQLRLLPIVVNPLHVLLTASPYLDPLLGMAAVHGKYLGLQFVGSMVSLLEPYSVCMADDIMDKDGATARDTNAKGEGALMTSSETFEKVFGLAQMLTQTMATTPSEFHRVYAFDVYCSFARVFAEHNRYKFVTSLIELCPYASVVSVIISSLHHEILAEYRILDEGGPGSATTTATSAFLHQRILDFISRMVLKVCPDVERNNEILVALLNLYRFIALYDKSRNVLGVKAQYKAFREGPLKAVSVALETMAPSDPKQLASAEFNILTFAVEMVTETITD